MKKIENPIEELKNRILKHIANGGNIYQPKRQLPYYDYLKHVKDKFSKRDSKEYTTADIYKLCGYDFNPEYNDFLLVVADLQDISDSNNYVDRLFNFKKSRPEAYSKLCYLATNHGSCLYDCMVLMTGYRLKDANINLDYEIALKERLKLAYPNRNISGIRRQYPNLYYMLEHLRDYKYPKLKMYDIYDMLGFYIDKMPETYQSNINEQELVNELEILYPDKVITKINNPSLYSKIIKISLLKNLSIEDCLNKLGFKYSQGLMIERLAQMKVNEKARYNFLMEQKKEFYKDKNLETLTDKEKYYLNLQLVEHVAKLDNVKEFIKSKHFVEEKSTAIDPKKEI